ncbi:MAG: hypothetical protein WDM89_13290 [Rhizomicrobium sp.]
MVYAETFLDHDHLAARDEAVVHIDVDGFTDLAVQFHDRALPSFRSSLTSIADLPSTQTP